MRPPNDVILSLGMPRSGTTLLMKMFEHGRGYFYQKICEYHPWHPMNGPDLIRLVNTFRRRTLVVVRSYRNVEDVVASLRVGVEMGNKHPWSDQQVRTLHAQEAENWAAFRDTYESEVDGSIRATAVEIDYDRLHDTGYRKDVLGEVVAGLNGREAQGSRKAWLDYLDRVWEKEPVNVGRLKRAVG